MQTKPLTAEQAQQIITNLEAIADTLFAANKNTLGNKVQEIVYCLEAEEADWAEMLKEW